MIYIKPKLPDEIQYHYHAKQEGDECRYISLPVNDTAGLVILAVDPENYKEFSEYFSGLYEVVDGKEFIKAVETEGKIRNVIEDNQ